MYNQHTRGMATTRHRSLVERGGRKALLETLHTHTKKKTRKKKCQKKPMFTNLKKRFEHIEIPAKLLNYFLRSNKRNINQSPSLQLSPRQERKARIDLGDSQDPKKAASPLDPEMQKYSRSLHDFNVLPNLQIYLRLTLQAWSSPDVCLCICCYKAQKSLLRLPPWAQSKTPGRSSRWINSSFWPLFLSLTFKSQKGGSKTMTPARCEPQWRGFPMWPQGRILIGFFKKFLPWVAYLF